MDRSTVELATDPATGFHDFLEGLAYLVEVNPATLNIVHEGQVFTVTVYSSRHNKAPIEPATISMIENGSFTYGGVKEPVNTAQLMEHMELFAKAAAAADVEPIIQLSSAKGVSREDGIGLLRMMAHTGIEQMVVPDHASSGPMPETTSKGPLQKPSPPSGHPPYGPPSE